MVSDLPLPSVAIIHQTTPRIVKSGQNNDEWVRSCQACINSKSVQLYVCQYAACVSQLGADTAPLPKLSRLLLSLANLPIRPNEHYQTNQVATIN